MPVTTVASSAAETYEGWKAIGAVCGPIISGLLALVAIYLTNRGHEKRLQIQLRNDDVKKDSERELTMRKEIFLNAADAIDKQMLWIGTLAILSASDENIQSELTFNRKQNSRIYLVGSEELIKAYVELTNHFTTSAFSLLSLRINAKKAEKQLLQHQSLSNPLSRAAEKEHKIREVNLHIAFLNAYGALLKGISDVSLEQSNLMRDVIVAARADLKMEINDSAVNEIILTLNEKANEMGRIMQGSIENQLVRKRALLDSLSAG